MTLDLPIDLSDVPVRETRLVSASDADVRPLFPTTRLFQATAHDTERLRDEAKDALETARAEATRIVEQAQAEASRIELAANASAAGIRAEAFEQGRREGTEGLARIVEALESEVGAVRDVYPHDVARKALEWAGLIVGSELATDPSLIVPFLEPMIAKVRHRAGVVIRLHPEDAILVSEAMDEVRERLGLAEAPRVIADEAQSRHSVHVETSERAFYADSVDERVDKFRARVERELKKRRKQ